MLKRLTKNLGLKLLAVLVAFAVWLIVINYADPVGTNEYSGIHVNIINSSSLTDKGKVYEVINNSDTVNVEVRGKRSVVDNLSIENITAYADLEDITIMNTVAIQVVANKNNDQIDSIHLSRNMLELAVEDRKEMPFTVNIVTTGEPADGYVRGEITQNQNSVRVSGPESVVNRIARAECNVSVAGRTTDLATSADIRLYDKNNNTVTHHNLKTNISSINVGVEILPTKAVDIEYDWTGEPAEGYVVTGEPRADRTAIYVAGRSSALNRLNVVSVPASELSVDGATKSISKQIDINSYLPDGVRLVLSEGDSFDGKVNVSLDIEELQTRVINIPIANITTKGTPEGYISEVLLDAGDGEEEPARRVVQLPVSLKGIEAAFDGVTGVDLRATADIAAYLEENGIQVPEEGIYSIELQLTLPEGLEVAEPCYADIRLQKEAEEEEE